MDKYLFKFRFIFLGIILILGFYLRSNNLYTWPRLGATFDEYAWTWIGISIIQNKMPESWSPHPQYKDAKNIIYQKTHFRMVKPYLEHPPFFGLVAGTYALLSGAKDMFHLTLYNIRGLAVLLGILSIFIIYIFAAEIYGYKVGLLTSLIYATVPTVVVGSRIVQNENFFIPFFLLALFLISKFIKSKKSLYRNLSAIICGFLILAKIPWAAGGFSIFLILLFLKKYKDAFKFISIVIFFFFLFILYGMYLDLDLFFKLFSFQLQRYDIAFNSLFALFTSPYLADRFLIDGWIYFGWFAMFLIASKDLKNNFLIVIPFLVYLIIFIFAIPNEPSHGWYRYPFYPFIIIATAVFIKDYFNKNPILTFLFLIFTGLSLLQLSWAVTFGFSFIIFRFFLILYALSLIPIFIPKTKKLSAIANYFSLTIIFILNIWSVLLYNEQ